MLKTIEPKKWEFDFGPISTGNNSQLQKFVDIYNGINQTVYFYHQYIHTHNDSIYGWMSEEELGQKQLEIIKNLERNLETQSCKMRALIDLRHIDKQQSDMTRQFSPYNISGTLKNIELLTNYHAINKNPETLKELKNKEIPEFFNEELAPFLLRTLFLYRELKLGTLTAQSVSYMVNNSSPDKVVSEVKMFTDYMEDLLTRIKTFTDEVASIATANHLRLLETKKQINWFIKSLRTPYQWAFVPFSQRTNTTLYKERAKRLTIDASLIKQTVVGRHEYATIDESGHKKVTLEEIIGIETSRRAISAQLGTPGRIADSRFFNGTNLNFLQLAMHLLREHCDDCVYANHTSEYKQKNKKTKEFIPFLNKHIRLHIQEKKTNTHDINVISKLKTLARTAANLNPDIFNTRPHRATSDGLSTTRAFIQAQRGSNAERVKQNRAPSVIHGHEEHSKNNENRQYSSIIAKIESACHDYKSHEGHAVGQFITAKHNSQKKEDAAKKKEKFIKEISDALKQDHTTKSKQTELTLILSDLADFIINWEHDNSFLKEKNAFESYLKTELIKKENDDTLFKNIYQRKKNKIPVNIVIPHQHSDTTAVTQPQATDQSHQHNEQARTKKQPIKIVISDKRKIDQTSKQLIAQENDNAQHHDASHKNDKHSSKKHKPKHLAVKEQKEREEKIPDEEFNEQPLTKQNSQSNHKTTADSKRRRDSSRFTFNFSDMTSKLSSNTKKIELKQTQRRRKVKSINGF